jgi:hypothetical protein
MGELLLATLARPARAFNRIDIEREAMVCHCDLLPIELQLDDSAYGAGSCSRLIRQLVLNTQHDISQIVDDGADCVCSCRHSANYLLSLSARPERRIEHRSIERIAERNLPVWRRDVWSIRDSSPNDRVTDERLAKDHDIDPESAREGVCVAKTKSERSGDEVHPR